jgi:integrase
MSYLIELHLDDLRAAGKSPATIAARSNVIRRLHDALPFGIAYGATELIQQWMANPAWGRWCRATYDYHVRGFYRWATESGILDGDPTKAMGRPKPPRLIPRPASEDDLELLLAQAGEPLFTIAVLGGFAGMRVGEMSRCRREHITEERIYIPLGKGGDPGTVPTHPFLWESLRDRPPGLLIVDRHGEPVIGHWISQTARRHLDKLGLPDLHSHLLRHRYGTTIQRTFGNIRITQQCLRHVRVSSTEGYTLVTSEECETAVAALPVPGRTGPASA